MSVLEITANVFNAASIVLAARNRVSTWWTGIVGCLLFAALFYQARLYADMTLQFIFVTICVFGWWRWLRGNHGSALPVTRCPPRLCLIGVALALLAAFGYGALLRRFTDAYSPFWDSLVLTFSVLSQLSMMQRQYESWWGWLAVNSVAVPLYLSRGLHLTAVLYLAFWINAVAALVTWRRLVAQPASGS